MCASAAALGLSRRRCLVGTLGLSLGLVAGRYAAAQDVTVPIGLQIELLGKVVAYDRNFRARSAGRARVMILVAADNLDSRRSAERVSAALANVSQLGGLPHENVTLPFSDGQTLIKECQSRSIGLVCVTPGLESSLPEIVTALTGLDLLSVSVSPAHVPARIVLGFDLIGGKPKILVHLDQARLQHVSFHSGVLKLARVYQ